MLYDGKPDERKLIRDTRLVDMRFNVMLTHYDMIIRDKTALISTGGPTSSWTKATG